MARNASLNRRTLRNPAVKAMSDKAHGSLIDQPFRSLHTPRRGDFARRRTRVTEKQP